MSRKKRKSYLNGIVIDTYAAEGKSIAHLEDGKVLFVEQVVPGDIIDVVVTKDRTSWAEGKVLKLVTPSPLRIDSFCEHFGTCGGCKWQMLPYSLQLEYKQQQVADQLQRIGHIPLPEINKIIGSEYERYYRNKLEFTFSSRRFLTHDEIAERGDTLTQTPALGFHAPGLFDKVVPVNQCYLQPDPSNKILSTLKAYTEQHELPYYDFKLQIGWLRNVVIRVATTREVLVNLVLQHERKEEREAILNHLLVSVPEITSLHYTINPKVNDMIHDLDVFCYYGKGYIEEKLEDFTFKISPKSFFQTNTKQAEKLYNVARDFAGLTGDEILYDLYCGAGSIGIFCSPKAKKIVGIEVIDDAVADAKENAALNGLKNCSFYSGDVSAICTDEFFTAHGRPDVIITDPPRAGMHEKLISQLLKISAPKIVYVSCNPATQARDLQLLGLAYEVVKLQPVDMFPHTHHIENVALLVLKN